MELANVIESSSGESNTRGEGEIAKMLGVLEEKSTRDDIGDDRRDLEFDVSGGVERNGDTKRGGRRDGCEEMGKSWHWR